MRSSEHHRSAVNCGAMFALSSRSEENVTKNSFAQKMNSGWDGPQLIKLGEVALQRKTEHLVHVLRQEQVLQAQERVRVKEKEEQLRGEQQKLRQMLITSDERERLLMAKVERLHSLLQKERGAHKQEMLRMKELQKHMLQQEQASEENHERRKESGEQERGKVHMLRQTLATADKKSRPLMDKIEQLNGLLLKERASHQQEVLKLKEKEEMISQEMQREKDKSENVNKQLQTLLKAMEQDKTSAAEEHLENQQMELGTQTIMTDEAQILKCLTDFEKLQEQSDGSTQPLQEDDKNTAPAQIQEDQEDESCKTTEGQSSSEDEDEDELWSLKTNDNLNVEEIPDLQAQNNLSLEEEEEEKVKEMEDMESDPESESPEASCENINRVSEDPRTPWWKKLVSMRIW